MTLFDRGGRKEPVATAFFNEVPTERRARLTWLGSVRNAPPLVVPTRRVLTDGEADDPTSFEGPIAETRLATEDLLGDEPLVIPPGPSASPAPGSRFPSALEGAPRLDAFRQSYAPPAPAPGLECFVPSVAPAPIALSGPVAEAILRLGDAVSEIAGMRDIVLADSERDVVRLAIAIAKKVIGRELATDTSSIVRLAREGIEALGARDKVRIRVGPLPEEAVTELRTQLASHRAEVVVDASLEPGKCLVETDFGHVDESIGARLDAVLAALPPLPEKRGW
jgi:hypothetical protein